MRTLVVAADMGYGHLRAAAALANAAGLPVVPCDGPPLADDAEQALWARVRNPYEALCRGASYPVVGSALRRVVNLVTHIPRMRTTADLRPPTDAVRVLRRLAERGLGRGLVARLHESGEPLLATFYAPAIVASDAGLDRVTLVVTDTDVNRVWVPERPETATITYCVPAERAAERLRRYGVPEERIVLTGFPLPLPLVGGEDHDVARRNLGARLVRLDPSGAFRRGAAAALAENRIDATHAAAEPPLLVIAVGGAGAQVPAALDVLRAFAPHVRDGGWRVALVAGTRAEVAAAFHRAVRRAGLEPSLGSGVEISHTPSLAAYFDAFERRLAHADVLWTKPSELTFYAALGLPLLLAHPLGSHEKANRRWALGRGAAFDARDGRSALDAALRGLADGSLANAAWNGFLRMPRDGTRLVLRAAGTPIPPPRQ